VEFICKEIARKRIIKWGASIYGKKSQRKGENTLSKYGLDNTSQEKVRGEPEEEEGEIFKAKKRKGTKKREALKLKIHEKGQEISVKRKDAADSGREELREPQKNTKKGKKKRRTSKA